MDTEISRAAEIADGTQTGKRGFFGRFIRRLDIWLLLAFVIPSMLMWLIYIAMQVWPFGEGAVLVLDLNGQYVYFFEELRNKLFSGGSLLYTWSRSLGGEFMGIFAYYIASPFSILVALFPKSMITEALLTIILLKVGSCGFTMSLYLKKARPTVNPVNTVIFSTMYALCSYAVVQAHNTMWIDEMIFLPLLVLGIERLIDERKFILFTVSLAFAAMTSFYIGYMMCIFTFLYFFYYYFIKERTIYDSDGIPSAVNRFRFLKSLGLIALFSVIALAIAMVVLYPAYVSLTFGKTTFSDPKFTFTQKFDFLDMVAKLFPASYDTVRPEGLPFIYCGTLTIILLPLYFISSNVLPREKIGTGLLIAALIFSFNGSTIDIIWHGFQKPNWLNYRYSFMLCFIMVVAAYRVFENLRNIEYKYIVGMCGVLGVLLMIIQKQDYEWLGDIRCVWLSIACLAVYAVALHPINKQKAVKSARLVLLVIVSVELFVSGLLDDLALDDDVVYSTRTSYRNYIEKLQPAVDFLKAYDAENFGSEFYRMEKNSHRKTNDSMALGFYGISNSTSTLNSSVITLLNKMGYASKSHWTKYLGGTPVADSLLGLKYLIFTDEYNERLYSRIYSDDENLLYGFYNPYALSLCYGADKAVKELNVEDYKTPFEFLNDLVTSMLGEEEQVKLFKKLRVEDITYENCEITFTTNHKKYTPTNEAKTAKLIFTFEAKSNDEIFCYFPSDYKREVDLSLNGSDIGTYFANETYRIVSLGEHEAQEQLIVSMKLNDDNLYIMSSVDYFYYLDTELFKEIMPRLADTQMNITSFYDTNIEGEISLGDNQTVFTTIPYDEGWIVTIDGERVDTEKTLDSLLAFDAGAGEHTVILNYHPSCFYDGLYVTIAGLAAFAGIIVVDKLLKRSQTRVHD